MTFPFQNKEVSEGDLHLLVLALEMQTELRVMIFRLMLITIHVLSLSPNFTLASDLIVYPNRQKGVQS